MANEVEQFDLDGETYTFCKVRWAGYGGREVTRADVVKKLNSMLVNKWVAEKSQKLLDCDSDNVGDNYDLAIQCADARYAADSSDYEALSVKIAATRDCFKQNRGCTPQLKEAIRVAEKGLAGVKRGSGSNKARTSLAAAYLDLAELYAEGPRKDVALHDMYIGKADECLALVPKSNHRDKVWYRLQAMK